MKHFKNILLYVGTDQNEAAICRSVKLAIENDATLTMMDVVKPLPKALGMMTDVAHPKELETLVAKDHREKLLKIASEYLDTGVPIDVVVSIGDPACEIVRQVLLDKHDLVLKTADGISAAGRLFGSVARSLLRLCPCPVWLLKPEIHGDFDRVLAAVDVEAEDKGHAELNGNILELAFSIAGREKAELHIVSAWDLWMETSIRRHASKAEIDTALVAHERRVRESLDELLQVPYANVDAVYLHCERGAAVEVIRSTADEIEADLIVMGTVCRTGVTGLLIGNTAESVLTDVTCSILALKPKGFRSPLEIAEAEVIDCDKEVSLR